MHIILNPRLDHPAYHAAVRLPDAAGTVTVFQAACSTTGAHVLRQANPDWDETDHMTLADLHATESAKQLMRYNALLNSGTDQETALHHAASARHHHNAVAMAHLQAARPRNRKKR
jgi:hypothetical protein